MDAVAFMGRQLMQALEFIHSKDLVHLDIKPSVTEMAYKNN